MVSVPIDVLVLTPLSQELKALRAELGQSDEENANNNFSYVIWRHVALKEWTEDGCLVAVMPIEKDQIPAGNTTHLALNKWSPRCFAIMGIGGQLNMKASLGDVVMGCHVWKWDVKRKERAEPGGKPQTDYSPTPGPSATWGANSANLLKSDPERYKAWKVHCVKDRPSELAGGDPELHVEDIASGSATIDSEYTRQMISAFSRYLFAVETEAAAALEAFQSRHPSLPSILIRGISDPSASKSESDAVGDGAWRRYAARNAAKLLVYLLSIYKIPTIEADSLLPPSDNVYSDKELSRLRQVFASPNIYDKAKDTLISNNRLVIIKGPGGIGKTTTGINLLLDIQERYTAVSRQVLTPQPTVRNLRHLAQLRDTLILLDAPFGVRDTYEPIDLSFLAHFDLLLDISKNNWVVITTRSEPLKRAAEMIERRDLQRYMITLSEDAYDDNALRLILEKHLGYYLDHGPITQWAVEYVSDQDKTRWIIRNLRFPLNIARFVRDELPEVIDQETLKSALDRAKDTRQAAMLYFRKLDGESKYFMFAVALFCDLLDNDTFSRILRSLFSVYSVSNTNPNVPLLRQKVRYIREWGHVAFEHQDYFDGIMEAIADPIFNDDIRRLSDLLANFSEDPDVEVRRSLWFPLKELSRVDPEASAGIVLKLLRSEDDRVREAAFIPLRVLVRHHFEKVQSYLERIVAVDQTQKSNPDYKWILFRKAVRDYVLGPYIERGDAQGIYDLTRIYNKDLKIHVFIIVELYQVYKMDKQKAMTFFSRWWKLDPRNLTSLQDYTVSRHVTRPRAEFIADALGQLPQSDAFTAIIDWSRSESKRDDFRKNLIRVISTCLERFNKTCPADVGTLVTEWDTSGNDIQRSAVRLFRQRGVFNL